MKMKLSQKAKRCAQENRVQMIEEDINSLEAKLHTIVVDIAKRVLDFAAGWHAGSSLTKVPKTGALFAAADYAKSYLSTACLVDFDIHPNDIAIVLGDNSNVFACSKMVLAKVDRNADSTVSKIASWSRHAMPVSAASWLRDWTVLKNIQNDNESMWIVEQALLSGSPLVLAKSRWRTEGIEVMPSCKTLVEVCKAASIDPYQLLLEDDLKRDYSLGYNRE